MQEAEACFNSTTVQLIPRLTQEKSPINEFQFHNGTINTKFFEGSGSSLIRFQFHNGTINTLDIKEKTLLKDVSIPQRYN